jgi:hypothetical protein
MKVGDLYTMFSFASLIRTIGRYVITLMAVASDKSYLAYRRPQMVFNENVPHRIWLLMHLKTDTFWVKFLALFFPNHCTNITVLPPGKCTGILFAQTHIFIYSINSFKK